MFLIKSVSKQFGTEYALRKVSMNIGKGLNFIIGSSGSGKTTLLKIISGMEQAYEGEVFYCGQNIKTLSEGEKSYFYSSVFGFVWQDFNLLDDLTVLENVMLPQYLKEGQDKKAAMGVLCELKIGDLAAQKAGKLSGGQKQRVAIARELLKNPQVIIADEPTSALDEKAAKTTMDILRELAKNRTVIVVTHDTSLIDSSARVYELDKGELVAAYEALPRKSPPINMQKPHKLSFQSACKLGVQSTKSGWGRFVATSLSLLVAATLLLVPVSGAIGGSSQAAFEELLDTYGAGILDINVVGSFTSAGGTGEKEEGPSANVSQNIDGLYDKYYKDQRVSHIVFAQAYHDIQITVDGKVYKIQGSNSVPVVEELTAGRMPMGDGSEILVPRSFVKTLGLTDEEVLGKKITFGGSVYNWDSGAPVSMQVEVTAEIVGVVDTTVKYDTPDGLIEYTVDDAFFFSRMALDQMRGQANIENGSSNFTIRAKTPADMIAIKDELNANGIVPLGRFELMEDMVRLGSQTAQQSGSAIVLISMLAVVVVLAVSLLMAFARRREYAIFQVSGYSRRQLAGMTAVEFLIGSAVSAVLFLGLSPLTNLATTGFWNVNLLNGKLLATGSLLVLGMGALSALVTMVVAVTTRASTALETGDKS